MPVLPLEPYVFPNNLFENCETLPDSRWWVLQTRSKTEKVLARRLCNQGIRFFLPLYSKTSIQRGREWTAHLPLFPNYIFFQGDEEQRQVALESNLLVNCLRVYDSQTLHRQLEKIYQVMAQHEEVTPEPHIRPGTPVEITSGSLTGMKGTVIQRGKQLRFVVEVEMLHQGISVEVERWMFTTLA